MKYTALGEGLVTNIAFGFASCYICHSTSPQAVYFMQTGGSALSNTYTDIDLKVNFHSGGGLSSSSDVCPMLFSSSIRSPNNCDIV